jgi:hypothetical protein
MDQLEPGLPKARPTLRSPLLSLAGGTVFENTPRQDRIDLAKARMPKVVDHLLYLIELHANNEYAVYSSTLSSQIPKSYAANAFLVFQRSMYQLEIVRLCALWDSADLKKENIATVIELIDDDEIIQLLADEAATGDLGQISIINPTGDSVLDAKIAQAARDSDEQFGIAQSIRARCELRETIASAREIAQSEQLKSIMNARHKYIAHSLTETKLERRGPILPMKVGDETNLIERSIPIVERLFCWVNGTSFSIRESQRIDQDNAEALWKGCTFNVLR